MTTRTAPLQIDRDMCVGHGRCYSLLPALFEADDYGYGVVKDQPDDLAGADLDRVINACPELAIERTTSE